MPDGPNKRVDEIDDILTRQEPLHPDLLPYVYKDSRLGWTILKHPFVISLPHWDQLNALMNRQYAFKQQAVIEARAERNWTRFLVMYERPFRVMAFISIEAEMTDEEYWEHLGGIWTDTENVREEIRNWKRLWRSKRAHKELVMDEEDRAALGALPDRLTVYRGVGHLAAVSGMSWSLDRDRAIWFGNRYAKIIIGKRAKHIWLAEAEIEKRHIHAYLTGRNETEIVVSPERVKDAKVVRMPLRKREN